MDAQDSGFSILNFQRPNNQKHVGYQGHFLRSSPCRLERARDLFEQAVEKARRAGSGFQGAARSRQFTTSWNETRWNQAKLKESGKECKRLDVMPSEASNPTYVMGKRWDLTTHQQSVVFRKMQQFGWLPRKIKVTASNIQSNGIFAARQ